MPSEVIEGPLPRAVAFRSLMTAVPATKAVID